MKHARVLLLVLVAALAAAADARADPGGTAEGREARRPERADSPDPQTVEMEYESWFGDRRYEPHYVRAAVEIAALMGAGLVYYWQDPLANSVDWDNPTLEDRLTLRALRFDTNLNTTNHLLHPAAGALVHDVARVNGLGLPAAIGYGIAQSALWELALEWREKASINDLVYTAVGGVPLGEFLFHTHEYFTSAPRGGLGHDIAAWTLGFPRQIHTALDDDDPAPIALPPDELGFSSAYGHRFGLSYEVAALSNEAGDEGTMHSGRIDAELVAMPRFLARGRFSQTFTSGNFTELHARFGFDGARIIESDLQVRATLFGHYAQDFVLDDEGDVTGHALMFGIGPGLRFQRSNWLGRQDQLSTVHLPGAHGELWLRDGDLAARIGAEVSPDFASIESLAWAGFVERFGDEGTKSVLQREGYQYSLGTWTRLRGSVALDRFAIRGSIGYGQYGSIEGLDRFQSRATRDVHGTETVLETAADASFLLGPLSFGVGFRERRRESNLGAITERRRDRDVHLNVGLVF